MSNIRLFCIDIGYSLAKANNLYLNHDYPGHLLYGINHLNEYGIEPIFQKGIVGNRAKSNLKALNESFVSNCDCIYIPFIDWGIGIAVLRRLKLIRKPVVALAHGYKKEKTEGTTVFLKLKQLCAQNCRRFAYKGCDRLIFISERAYKEYMEDNSGYPKFLKRTHYIPLQPEIVSSSCMTDEYNGIITSIGKTNREYTDIIEYAEKHPEIDLTIIDNTFTEGEEKSNVHIVRKYLHFSEIAPIYQKTDVVLIPVKETGGGVYGLSSVMDALAFRKPILASKTEGLGIDIDLLGLGKTYECGNGKSLNEAVKFIETHYKSLCKNIDAYVMEYNINSFTKQLSMHIIDVVKE